MEGVFKTPHQNEHCICAATAEMKIRCSFGDGAGEDQ